MLTHGHIDMEKQGYFYSTQLALLLRRHVRYSYTTPDFTNTWGYQPMRKPYTEYRFLKYKDHNNQTFYSLFLMVRLFLAWNRKNADSSTGIIG